MYYLILPRRRLGIAIDKKELQNAQPFRGDIHINKQHSVTLGRDSVEAWIFTSKPNEYGASPRLLDVTITGMSTLGMNLSGIEQVGEAFYFQSWWCRLE